MVKNVKLEAAESEIPLGDPRILYNQVMVELERIKGSESTGTKGAGAQLNVALCYMYFQEWDKAAELLESIKLSDTSGICQGTALFRLGQCYEAMGQWKKATESYEKTKNFPNCTLINSEGPPASQEAAIRLQYLAHKALNK